MKKNGRTPLSGGGVPFALNRNLATSLTDQIVESFETAVDAGVYADGDPAPSLRALAAQLGVSLIVVRRAYARLKADGVLSVRRGLGCRVVGRRDKLWKGRVLLVGYGLGDHYVSNVVMSVLRTRFLELGYLVSSALTQRTEDGCRQLEHMLRQRFDLIVSLCDEDEVLRRLRPVNTPVIAFCNVNWPDWPNAVSVGFGDRAAMPDFAAHCLRCGVTSVLEVSINPLFATVEPELRGTGVAYRRWLIRPRNAFGRIEDVMRQAQEMFERQFARHGKSWLPDVLYFADDFVATAALTSLAVHGVQIPQDVRVVTWYGRGLGPVFPISLTRIEFDPFAAGEELFRIAAAKLAGASVPSGSRVDAVYRIGESFPENWGREK